MESITYDPTKEKVVIVKLHTEERRGKKAYMDINNTEDLTTRQIYALKSRIKNKEKRLQQNRESYHRNKNKSSV